MGLIGTKSANSAPTVATITLSTTRSKLRRDIAAWTLVVVFLPVSFAAALPFFWMYLSSFKQASEIYSVTITWFPSKFYLGGYEYAIEHFQLVRAYSNSIFVSAISVSASVMTSAMAGFLFAKKQFWGKNLLFVFVLSTLMVPFFAIFIPSFVVYAVFLNLKNTYFALILPNIFTAFGILITRQFLHSIPGEMIDSATVDGAGDWRVFWHIILPLSKSVLAAIAILQFLGAFNEFLWPLVMIDSRDLYTLPLALRKAFAAQGPDPSRLLAGAVLSLTPILIFFLIFQRHIVRGISLTGVKG